MWRNLFVMTAAAAGLSVAIAADAGAAQRMGMHGGSNVHATVGVAAPSRTTIGTRSMARGPAVRPHGWSEGRKTGWHCRVGARTCIPPGLR